MAAEPGAAPRRAPRGEPRRRKKGVGALGLFLLCGAAPLALLGWYFTRPAEEQAAMLSRIPEGAGGRAIKAGACVLLLFALARVALPAFHGAGATLKGWRDRLHDQPLGLRMLLFPAEAVLWLLWFVTQALFALDAALIVGAAAGTLVLVARILKPDLLSDVLPPLLQ